ncbi:MAG: alpha-L-arabinofuranosidase C-terminal domain-containing protein, partial [Chloroflexota bacterium]
SYDVLYSYGSPSYYVQKLFSVDHGDVVAPSRVSAGSSLAVVASKVTTTGTLYVTVVNTSAKVQAVRVSIKGISSVRATGTATVLTSTSTDDENSLSTPTKVAPKSHAVSGLGPSFPYNFPANSVTVLQLGTHA